MKTITKYGLLALSTTALLVTAIALEAPQSLASQEEHAASESDAHESEDEHGHGAEEGHEEAVLKLTAEQLEASGIEIIAVTQGNLSQQVSVPGRIVADANRMAKIVPKVSGVVTEARKNLGDKVFKGETVALIESREMADAAAELQAAARSAELAKATYTREKTLWEKKVTAEQDYLSARNAWQEAQIRLDLARQKTQALGGVNDKASRYYELKSPLDGVVVERELTLGEFVDTSHHAFTVADLSTLWVEIAVPPSDLQNVREGQTATITGNGKDSDGKLIFISPVINPDTRSAKAIVELANEDGKWRSGDYANVAVLTDAQASGVTIPLTAVQTLEGKSVVFVQTAEGFERREITAGNSNGQSVEIASGLTAGEYIATGNTFVLKAEAGKSEAEHEH